MQLTSWRGGDTVSTLALPLHTETGGTVLFVESDKSERLGLNVSGSEPVAVPTNCSSTLHHLKRVLVDIKLE